MKNRLQIRYHIPESLPTRVQAMAYLKETFAIGRTNSDNASLPAEPLVLLYNDTPLDIANGITEAKRLETANVLLAIGRGGDGVNIFNNQDYFVIDFAKHEEDITELTSNIENIFDIIKEINDTITEMKAAIAKNANDIAEIIKKIGEKGDNSLKDTVYGFIQGAYDAIDAEVNRASDAERELQHNIDIVNAAVATEKERALQAESDLQTHINTEEAARIDGDNDNRNAIESETLRATNAETELRTNLQAEVDRAEGEESRIENLLNDEVARAIAKEGELNAKIDDTNANLLKEINRAGAAEKDLQHNIDIVNAAVATEKERALQAESDLQTHISTEESARIDGDNDNRNAIESETLRATNAETELRGNLQAEVNRAEGEEARIESLLNDEVARAIAKEGELNAKIDDTNANLLKEINRASLAEQALEDAIKLEETTRRDNDDALQSQITTLNQALQAESTERTTQDLLLSQRIDENAKQIKENKVSSNRKTITVTGPTENGTNIDVNVDNKTIVVNESGTLSVSSDALVQYVGENAINVSDVTGGTKTISLVVNPNDKILTNDVQGLLATLSLKWNHADATGEKDEIQLIGKDGIVISRIDVADFIKDGILDNVVLNSVDANNPYLSFTFNSASGKETINVSVKDLVEIYFAGNGLEINENTFSIKIDNSSEVFLTVSNDGLKLSGIQTAIDNAKLEVQSIITNEVEVLTTAISNLTNDLNDEVTNRLTADNKIENDYKTADIQLRSEFKTADDTVRSEFKSADDAVRSEFILADTQLRSEFKSADDTVRSEFKTADDAVRSEFILADTKLRTEFKSADDTVRSEFKTADDAVRSEFILADTQLRSELIGVTTNLETAYKAADKSIEDAYKVADKAIEDAYKAADKAIEDAYKEADNAIGLQITTINGNIDALSTKADGILPLAQQYTNEKVSELVTANALVEQELRTNIENNAKEISKISGDVSIDGSIKDIVFDSALGTIVNTITVDDATEQSLVKKFTLDGTPYVYVSNKTSDMKHNGNALNTVIDELRADINETINVTDEIKNNINILTLRVDGHDDAIENINGEVANNKIEIGTLKNEVAGIKTDITEIRGNIADLENSINTTITGLLAPMQEAITALQTELANTKAELETLKANAITSITGVDNEISVTVTDNTAVVGFAEDAYFVAG